MEWRHGPERARLADGEVHIWLCRDEGDPVAAVLRRYERRLCWSKSDSRGLALVAVTAAQPIAIDLEFVRDVKHAHRIGRRLLGGAPSDRRDFFSRWTKHEALVKATGGRLLEPTPDDRRFTVRELPAPDGYAATLAVQGRAVPVLYRLRH